MTQSKPNPAAVVWWKYQGTPYRRVPCPKFGFRFEVAILLEVRWTSAGGVER